MELSLFLLFIISFIPSLFWLWIFLREDSANPEPRRIIFQLFMLGISAAALSLAGEFIFIYFLKIWPDASSSFSALIENVIDFSKNIGKNNLWEGFVVFVLAAPIIEEFFKFFMVKKFAFGAKCFNQVIDGVIYSVSVALGFAVFENFLYFSGFLSEGVYFLAGGFVFRTFLSTLLHSLSAGWMGYWIGRARFDSARRNLFLAVGFIFAVALHAAFNFFVSYDLALFAIFSLIVIFDLLFIRLRSHESQLVRKWFSRK